MRVTRQRRRTAWLARDKYLRFDGEVSESASYYGLYFSRGRPKPRPNPEQHGDSVNWSDNSDISCCPELFEAVSGIHLEPGEGPVRVVIDVAPWEKGA